MAGEDDVEVKFGAQIDALVDGIKEVQDQIKGLRDGMGGVNESARRTGDVFDGVLQGIGQKIGGFLLEKLGEVEAMFQRLPYEIAEIGDAAYAIGITTDQLQQLDFVAKTVGVSTEAMHSAMGRFTTAAGNASRGGGELARTLAVNHVKLSGDIYTDFLNIVDLMHKADPEVRKFVERLAFGRSGSMGPLIRDGAEAIKRLAVEYKNLNLSFTEETIERQKRLNEAWNKTVETVTQFVKQKLYTVTVLINFAVKNVMGENMENSARLKDFMDNPNGSTLYGMLFGNKPLWPGGPNPGPAAEYKHGDTPQTIEELWDSLGMGLPPKQQEGDKPTLAKPRTSLDNALQQGKEQERMLRLQIANTNESNVVQTEAIEKERLMAAARQANLAAGRPENAITKDQTKAIVAQAHGIAMATDELQRQNNVLEAMHTAAQTVADSFMSVADGTATLGQALASMTIKLIDMVLEALILDLILSAMGLAAPTAGMGAVVSGIIPGDSAKGWGGPSHADGVWELPQDEVAMVHKGEMIVPAGPAEMMRNGMMGGGGASAEDIGAAVAARLIPHLAAGSHATKRVDRAVSDMTRRMGGR